MRTTMRPVKRTKPLYPRPLLKRAIWLGVVAAVLASLLLFGVFIIDGIVHGTHEESSTSDGNSVSLPAVVVIVVVATLVVSLVPGIVGGTTNAYVLYRLSIRGKLTRATSLASGLFIGFLAGFVTLPGIYLIQGDIGIVFRYRLAETVEFALLVACVAAPVGSWHGWRIGKWLLEAQRPDIGPSKERGLDS